MIFNNVVLESIGLHLPEEIRSSESIERAIEGVYRKFKVSVGRLELMTGIRERRIWDVPFVPSQESSQAAKKALGKSKISRDKIGLLVHGGVCRDRLEPATAAYVHGELALSSSVQFIDVSNACLGFVNGMLIAASMIESGTIESALIVTAEGSRELLENTIETINNKPLSRKELKSYFANLTIGSGAVAAVLCSKELSPDSPQLIGGVVGADSNHNELCEGGSNRQGHEMMTDSEALLKAGIGLAKQTWKSFKHVTGWNDPMINHYICHQVGKMHQSALYDALKIDSKKDFSTYPTLGNMGSAALPGTLAKAMEQEIFRKGEKVALLGIGSGISSIMLGLQI
ncbi:MAG: 3-oxoacyl-ACP synthase III [Opitutales bacterium]|nr:3-oxoacyl-ACP synthase III [Opitutales bacterium]